MFVNRPHVAEQAGGWRIEGKKQAERPCAMSKRIRISVQVTWRRELEVSASGRVRAGIVGSGRARRVGSNGRAHRLASSLVCPPTCMLHRGFTSLPRSFLRPLTPTVRCLSLRATPVRANAPPPYRNTDPSRHKKMSAEEAAVPNLQKDPVTGEMVSKRYVDPPPSVELQWPAEDGALTGDAAEGGREMSS